MSKKLKRSAVALVLAATMVFSSQGVLTAFAVGENETSTAVDVSALEPILDKEETVVVEEPGNTDETETPEVTEPCNITEGCTLSKGHEGECQVAPVDPPVEDENGEDETQPCTKTEGCTLENGHEGECVTEPVTPPEEENGEDETQPCEKTEGCTLPNGHEGECVVEENTEDTEDTQEPSEEDVAAAKNVSDLIGALPEASTLDPETTDVEALTAQVKAAREAYDKLTDAQKALVEKAVLDKLVALEGALEGLEQVETIPGNDVAEFNGTGYETFDEAIQAALSSGGGTVELLADCQYTTEAALAIDTSITIKGPYTLTFDTYSFGISDPNTILTLDGCTVNVNNAAYTAYSDNPANAAIMLNNGATLTLNNATLNINNPKGDAIAFWDVWENFETVNILNGSHYEASGCTNGGGFEDYNGRDYNTGILRPEEMYCQINIDASTVKLHDSYSGFIGSMDINISNDSTVEVCDNRGNGSNGANYYINNSIVKFEGNGNHGMSATDITSTHSTIISKDNGYYGVYSKRDFYIDKTSTMEVTGNSHGGDFAGLKLTSGITDGRVESGATVNITGNYCSGLSNNGKCVFEDGVKLTITGNNNDKGTTSNGGGIYNSGASANLTLPSNAVIYNNHADTAGDDIFNNTTSTITFGKVGSDWTLEDCGDEITGWFDDSEGNRWEAHDAPYHAEEFDEFEKLTGMATITGLHALKAAHGIDPIDPGEPGGGDWDENHSKSKTATPLDANYESDVTLSLPSAEEQLESDVVFVLDKSTSTIVEDEALAMLEDLQGQIAQTGAKVNVGVVIFNREAHPSEWFDLATQYEQIESAIKQEISSGTNSHAGLIAAQQMLASHSQVDNNRKYVIFVCDGITYMFDEKVNAINSQQATTGEYAIMAGNDCWGIRHYQEGGSNFIPDDWNSYLSDIASHLDEVEQYIQPYDHTSSNQNICIPRGNTELPTTVDVALYKTYSVFNDMLQSGYHCYSVIADTSARATYPWGENFMSYLQDISGNGKVSFEDIQNDIFYLLDAGSSVVDVIGYGTDNAGNEYNFDFVDNLDNLKITVGGNELDKEDIIDPQFNDPYVTSAYGFSDPASGRDGYDFVLKYYQKGQDGNSDECFVWEINVPVSNFAPVQLTYTVKLTNPQTAEGTYGEYDANGENGSTSLYTNKEATLYPVDSNGDSGVPENFPKPTVSYTVGGNDNPGTDPTPDPDPDPDRPSRPNRDDDDDWEPLPDAPVKDKPTTEVDVPEETETPTTEQPDKYNPETGDTTTVFAAMALAAVSLGGVVLLGRKKK